MEIGQNKVVPEVVEPIRSRYPQYSVKTHPLNYNSFLSDQINESPQRIFIQSLERGPHFKRRGRPLKVLTKANGQPLCRTAIQQKMAKIYLQSGYRIGPARKQVDFDMNLKLYNASMCNVLYEAFKKLENVAQTICRLHVQSSEEYKSPKFKNELCKGEKWMSAEELSTFREYVKSAYDLQPQTVSKAQTVRLFNSIISHWSKFPH